MNCVVLPIIHRGLQVVVARIGNAVAYLVLLAYHMLQSAITVAYQSLEGHIDPQVIEIQTVLKRPLSQTILANSITLTPGTLTIDVDEKKQTLTVAVLTPRPAAAVIPLEPYIRGMLE